MRALPQKKLDSRVVKAWRINAFFSTLAIAGIGVVAEIVLFYLGIAFQWIMVVLIVVVCLYAIIQIGIVPAFRYTRWRFEVTPEEIDLAEGILFRKRTIIPLVRVQSVDTLQGPVLRMFDISTVSIATAAGTHAIPALSQDEAATLRDHISALARVAREDV